MSSTAPKITDSKSKYIKKEYVRKTKDLAKHSRYYYKHIEEVKARQAIYRAKKRGEKIPAIENS